MDMEPITPAVATRRPLVIGIGGCSGSGKTTLAAELAGQLDATLFPLDLYYRDLSQFPLDSRHKRNFDHPDSLESELALHLLHGLARLVRNEVADRRPEEALGDLGKPISARLLLARLGHSRKSTRPARGRPLVEMHPASSAF